MKRYLMTDPNERYIHREAWVLETDCPYRKFVELCSLAHNLGSEEATEYDGKDFSDCWADSDYLEKLLINRGYKCKSTYPEVVMW